MALPSSTGFQSRAFNTPLKFVYSNLADVGPCNKPGIGFDELLPDADIVVVLLPATPEDGRADREARARQAQTGALLVNAGRGSVVDMDALCTELESGRLEAALDVTDPEPLPPESPLWRLPNVLLTPHIAGDSPTADQRVYELIGNQIRRHLKRKPLLNVVR